jgi:hypothetical protein
LGELEKKKRSKTWEVTAKIEPVLVRYSDMMRALRARESEIYDGTYIESLVMCAQP